jgi:hypothetical protein
MLLKIARLQNKIIILEGAYKKHTKTITDLLISISVLNNENTKNNRYAKNYVLIENEIN